jgi:hypothetical protein
MYLSESDEYTPGGKRNGARSSREQSPEPDDQDVKKSRVKGQKSVQKAKYFIVDLEDPTQVNAYAGRPAIIKSYIRQLVTQKGFTVASATQMISALHALQEEEALSAEGQKKNRMKCPGANCHEVLQTGKDEKELHKYFFRHWFYTQQHQPDLYNELARLIAKNEQGALNSFRKHGLPTSKVVPLPQVYDPMDEGDDSAQPEELDDESMPQPIAVAQEPEHAGSWYIVAANRGDSKSMIVFEAPTRQEVVKNFLASKVSQLSLESKDVQEQGRAYKVHEELVKQLLVQAANKELKKLVCPHAECEVMLSEEGQHSEKELTKLFAQMALHHMTTHPIEPENVLARKALAQAASTFEQAHANMLE